MQWQRFSGNNFEVGYQLGYWWGKKLTALQHNKEGKIFLAHRQSKYLQWINEGWGNAYLPLFRNVNHYFDDIIEELAGMCEGMNKAGYSITMTNLFSLILAETDVPRCSSFVIKTKDGVVLAHNEEEEIIYILCFAKVSLKTKNGVKEFMSISYPFQLLGSCFGLNSHFSFQGNSIGCKKQLPQLFKSWDQRIPKTVFTRKLLELDTIGQVMQLYSSYHSTLPNHHFLCTPESVWSLRIKPVINPDPSRADLQLEYEKVNAFKTAQVNHFLENGKIDREWMWGNSFDKHSEVSRMKLDKLIQLKNPTTAEECFQVIKEHRQRYSKITSASIMCEMRKDQYSIDTISYFHKSQHLNSEFH